MAEIILGVFAVLVAFVCLLITVVAFFGNAFGGVTAPDQVDHKPTIIFAVLFVAFFATGIWLLL